MNWLNFGYISNLINNRVCMIDIIIMILILGNYYELINDLKTYKLKRESLIKINSKIINQIVL